MTLTLQLPSSLSEELEQQAGRMGVTPEEHATNLLAIAAVIGDTASIPGARSQIASTMREAIRSILDRETSSEADRERLQRLAELLGRWAPEQQTPTRTRPSALGKYAHIPGTSDDFARLKQEEIDREDGSAA